MALQLEEGHMANQQEIVTKVVSAYKARQNFGRLLEEARFKNTRFLIQRSGRPMAMLLGIEEWENILETLAELADPEYLASIQEARREIELGQVVGLEELQAEVEKARHEAEAI
ncbi:MAG TPA: type II toxin-antitoxin system Phd/YefM family antitoxin [Dehalococcoidia bacterium]|nr:type II toxin-antitoxin system Phd/YefM family antitoxin [Dehalococcoidia bacterium]